MDIKCVPDGAFDPMTAMVQEIDCSDAEGSYNQYDEHNAVPDQSCLDEAPDKNVCLKYVEISLPNNSCLRIKLELRRFWEEENA